MKITFDYNDVNPNEISKTIEHFYNTYSNFVLKENLVKLIYIYQLKTPMIIQTLILQIKKVLQNGLLKIKKLILQKEFYYMKMKMIMFIYTENKNSVRE